MIVYVVQFEFRDSILVDTVFDSFEKAREYVEERGFREIPEEEDLDYRVHGFCLEIEGCDPFPHVAGWAWVYVREVQPAVDSAEDWNTRVERTCTFSRGHNGNDTEKQELPRCSACGREVDGYMCDFYTNLNNNIILKYPYNYCPNCGARVEEE